MKKVASLLLLFAIVNLSNAQSNYYYYYYYYYKGEKKYLTPHKKSFNIFTNENFQKSSTANIGVEDYILVEDGSSENKKFAQLELSTEPNNTLAYNQKLGELKQLPNVEYVGMFFENGDAEPVGISKHFYVKLKNTNDFNVLQQIALQKNVEIIKQVPHMPQWYIMAVSNGNTNTSLELGNQFYETGLFQAVDPAFMLNFSTDPSIESTEVGNKIPVDDGSNNDARICANDPNFSLQWG